MHNLNKVFYASEGSCAIEIALKMSLHSRVNCGENQRNQFVALKQGYHGETLGALSVSDLGLYRKPYESLLFRTQFIEPAYVSGTKDIRWNDAKTEWLCIESQLEPIANTITAIIFEPILQGAGGMKIYSQDFLSQLGRFAKYHNIHLIADEIMTGIGRTGKMLACEHAKITPDFLCLSKGLTSGNLPLSAVITTDIIYNMFYDDHETNKAFLHSHTYSGNALAASVAVATLDIITDLNLCSRAQQLQEIMIKNLEEISRKTGRLKNIRGIGAVVAADLIVKDSEQRLGYRIYHEAVKHGALLRPLGNTLYWLPPLTITLNTLEDLKNITLQAIQAVCRV